MQLEKEKKGKKVTSLSYAGSTAIIVLLTSDKIYVAHTGDSKAVLVKRK